ncbi:MAG: serine/threonine-protein phosphatase [Eubacterium sp.]|nr:serine/threonine-protein phosphatase [Eubacterium sp.]
MTRKEKAAKKEKKNRSISRAVLWILAAAVLVMLAISTMLNWSFMKIGVTALLSMSGSNAAVGFRHTVEMADGLEEYVSGVMDTYNSIPDEIRRKPDSDAYRAYFAPFLESDFYKETTAVLEKDESRYTFLEKDVYLAMYDREQMTLVYLLDPKESDQEWNAQVGEWEQADQEEMDAFFSKDEIILRHRNISERYGELLTIADPLINDEGEIIAFAMSDIPFAYVNASSAIFTILYAIVMTIALVILFLIIRAVMRRRLMKPIREISNAAEQYTLSRTDDRSDKKYFSQLNVHTGDELEELSHVMAGMEQEITVYEENLTKAAAEEERIQTELSLAAGIQLGMLPRVFPPYPERQEFDIYAMMDPAKEVGGDFYDFFLIDEDHLALVIADVSGKGIPAALFMMAAMIVLNNFASEGYSPAEVLRRANEKISRSSKVDMFVTVWFGILDLKTGVVTAANAGHEYPAVRHPEGEFELLHDKHSFVIGGMAGIKYKEYTFTLEPGASLFLYTDGVAEAANRQEKFYGCERMLAALNQTGNMTAQEILQKVRGDVDQFAEGAPQFDDLTMLCVTYKGC